MKFDWGTPMYEKIMDALTKGAKPAGAGNHRMGKMPSPHARRRLLATRRVGRMTRKRVRRQLAGRKHRR